MNLEQQVISLELAKKLKELGCKQESLFYWQTDFHPYGSTTIEDDGTGTLLAEAELSNHNVAHYSAFTVAELGEMLPESVRINENRYIPEQPIQYRGKACVQLICYLFVGEKDSSGIQQAKLIFGHSEEANTEADARTKLLCYLLENKFLNLE